MDGWTVWHGMRIDEATIHMRLGRFLLSVDRIYIMGTAERCSVLMLLGSSILCTQMLLKPDAQTAFKFYVNSEANYIIYS